MLMGDDKPPSPPAERFEIAQLEKKFEKTRSAWFEHLFLSFGGGAHLLEPLTKSKYWNAFCWTLIGIGIVGWIILFWILPPFSE